MSSYVAGFGIGLLLILLIPLLILLFLEVCLWKIYKKLGYPGWASIVPGYNLWIVANDFFGPGMAIAICGLICGGGALVGLSSHLAVLALIGILMEGVGSVLWLIVWYQVVRELGHGVGFFLGCMFLSVIFYPILAFERYEPEYNDRY